MATRRTRSHENDENSALTSNAPRLRSRTTTTLKSTKLVSKTTTAAPGLGTRKRSALGDVSNQAPITTITQPIKEPIKEAIKEPIKKTTRQQARQTATQTLTNAAKARQVKGSRKALGEIENVGARKRVKSSLAIETKNPNALESVKEMLGDDAKVDDDTESDANDENIDPQGQDEQEVRLDSKSGAGIIQEWDDLDAEEANDPIMCAEYILEIFDYLKDLEKATMPDEDYMAHQKDLQWRMRGILSDWLIEVHQKFRLLPETLFLAVNIVDRFLSHKNCSLSKLQLVGTTCLFIASKYEEVIAPSIQNFQYMSDGGYNEDDILKAERYILETLEFNLSYPNPMNFLRRISKADNYDVETRTIAKYLVELSVVEHRLIAFPPSLLSAAGLYLARQVMSKGEWDANLKHYSGYTEAQILPVQKIMVEYLSQPIKHDALFKKYASKKFIKASIIVRSWVRTYKATLSRNGSNGSEVSAAQSQDPMDEDGSD